MVVRVNVGSGAPVLLKSVVCGLAFACIVLTMPPLFLAIKQVRTHTHAHGVVHMRQKDFMAMMACFIEMTVHNNHGTQ